MQQTQNKEGGRKVGLVELYEYLKRFSLSDSLFVIGTINAVFRYGINKTSTQSIPDGTLKWIESYFPSEIARLSLMLNITRLARFLILSGANDYKKETLDTGTPELVNCLNLISDLYDERVEPAKIRDIRELNRSCGRIMQWQFPLQQSRHHLSSRAHLLFRKIPREMNCAYDIDQAMQTITGLTIFEFMAIGHAMSIMCNGVLKHNMQIEVASLKTVVTPEKIRKFIDMSSGLPDDYRRMIRGTDYKTSNPLLDLYGLDPFIAMPLVKVQHGMHTEKDSWVVPQVTYLWQRMSSGVFYIISEYERVQGEIVGAAGQNSFRDAFGEVYKKYVGLQLGQSVGTECLVDLDTIDYEGTRPDFALIKEDKAILFEVKVGLLSMEARCFADPARIREEITRQNSRIKKSINQLHEFSEAIKNGQISDARFSEVSKVVKIVVSYEDLYFPNAELLTLIKEELGDSITDQLQIMTVTDVDTSGMALANSCELIDAIFNKLSDEYFKEWSVDSYLRSHFQGLLKSNPLLDVGFKEFFSELTGKEAPDEDAE